MIRSEFFYIFMPSRKPYDLLKAMSSLEFHQPLKFMKFLWVSLRAQETQARHQKLIKRQGQSYHTWHLHWRQRSPTFKEGSKDIQMKST